MKLDRILGHSRISRVESICPLFASHVHHDGFSRFYGDIAHRTAAASIDDLASAYRLYLFLGELGNRR